MECTQTVKHTLNEETMYITPKRYIYPLSENNRELNYTENGNTFIDNFYTS